MIVFILKLAVVGVCDTDVLEIPLCSGQKLAGLVALGGADKTELLHTVDDLGSSSVAQIQSALESRGTDLILSCGHLQSLPELGILVVLTAAASTAAQAALVAREARVRRLVLTHFSNRYAIDPGLLLRQARAHFAAVEAAKDGFTIDIPLTDEEVGRAFQRIVDALKATAGIEVRES